MHDEKEETGVHKWGTWGSEAVFTYGEHGALPAPVIGHKPSLCPLVLPKPLAITDVPDESDGEACK